MEAPPPDEPELRDALLPLEDAGAHATDVETPEAAVRAVCEVLSGPAEEDRPRDRDRLRSLFLPGAHVFSPYGSRMGSRGADPVMRGVNGVQRVHARGRWWIAQIAWDVEGPGRSIPADHLPGRR